MTDEQSIRDQLIKAMYNAPTTGNVVVRYSDAADAILASPVIRRIQAEALRKFRADLVGSQFVRYGIVLPDINEIVDDLDEAADRIERGETA